MDNKQLVTFRPESPSLFGDDKVFDMAQRQAKMLSSSNIVPTLYQGNVANCMIAMEMAHRKGSSVIMVMQNLDIIRGKPGWKSSHVISLINSCRRFAPLEFEYGTTGVKEIEYTEWVGSKPNARKEPRKISIENASCQAYTTRISDGKIIKGPKITIEMAVKEGWWTKSDSKWPTMTETMLAYRAASFFGRLHAPDVLDGLYTTDEIMEFTDIEVMESTSSNKASEVIQKFNQEMNPNRQDEPIL